MAAERANARRLEEEVAAERAGRLEERGRSERAEAENRQVTAVRVAASKAECEAMREAERAAEREAMREMSRETEREADRGVRERLEDTLRQTEERSAWLEEQLKQTRAEGAQQTQQAQQQQAQQTQQQIELQAVAAAAAVAEREATDRLEQLRQSKAELAQQVRELQSSLDVARRNIADEAAHAKAKAAQAKAEQTSRYGTHIRRSVSSPQQHPGKAALRTPPLPQRLRALTSPPWRSYEALQAEHRAVHAAHGRLQAEHERALAEARDSELALAEARRQFDSRAAAANSIRMEDEVSSERQRRQASEALASSEAERAAVNAERGKLTWQLEELRTQLEATQAQRLQQGEREAQLEAQLEAWRRQQAARDHDLHLQQQQLVARLDEATSQLEARDREMLERRQAEQAATATAQQAAAIQQAAFVAVRETLQETADSAAEAVRAEALRAYHAHAALAEVQGQATSCSTRESMAALAATQDDVVARAAQADAQHGAILHHHVSSTTRVAAARPSATPPAWLPAAGLPAAHASTATSSSAHSLAVGACALSHDVGGDLWGAWRDAVEASATEEAEAAAEAKAEAKAAAQAAAEETALRIAVEPSLPSDVGAGLLAYAAREQRPRTSVAAARPHGGLRAVNPSVASNRPSQAKRHAPHQHHVRHAEERAAAARAAAVLAAKTAADALAASSLSDQVTRRVLFGRAR